MGFSVAGVLGATVLEVTVVIGGLACKDIARLDKPVILTKTLPFSSQIDASYLNSSLAVLPPP